MQPELKVTWLDSQVRSRFSGEMSNDELIYQSEVYYVHEIQAQNNSKERFSIQLNNTLLEINSKNRYVLYPFEKDTVITISPNSLSIIPFKSKTRFTVNYKDGQARDSVYRKGENLIKESSLFLICKGQPIIKLSKDKDYSIYAAYPD